ncbi:hypothetical protein [Tahibacter amnicola]|uniref:Uncharacterized protein n=1 Tax=Tahibacter amnicola TaxID=2976241 RepID=A0ABY6BN77_9GAMM|nr:hypothetical protein [Tahibacter amnicola]UXI69267.1 hypothetical protein N4264_06355 [Tahibacter amnicola]
MRRTSSISYVTERVQPVLASTVHVPTHPSAELRSHAFNSGVVAGGVQLFGSPGWPDSTVDESWSDEIVSDIVFLRLDGDQLRTAGVPDMQRPHRHRM